MTIVGDDKRPTPMPLPVREGSRMFCNLYGNCSLPRREGGGRVCYTLYSILNDVDEHLLEEDTIQPDGYRVVGQAEVDTHIGRRTQILKEGPTGLHLLAEVAEL